MALPAPEVLRQAMQLALGEARLALATEDVPIGAVVIDADGKVVGRGRNRREATGDPMAHAEVVALQDAAKHLGDWNLAGTTLIVTLEPCLMCAGAILAARVETVAFGAWDQKAGAAGSVYDVLRDRRLPYRVEVYSGIEAEACARLLTEFFSDGRSR